MMHRCSGESLRHRDNFGDLFYPMGDWVRIVPKERVYKGLV